MKQDERHIKTDLAIAGTGIAGVAAAIFALQEGMSVALTGNTGALAYTTGYLDLLGIDLGRGSAEIQNPWRGIEALRSTEPRHPLSRVTGEDIKHAFTIFTEYITDCGLGYTAPGSMNLDALSPVGTLKKTLCVPRTMLEGVKAFNARKKCLIIDFTGLRGFSGRQIAANLSQSWPELRHTRMDFPLIAQQEIYPEVAARTLEVEAHRALFADRLKEMLGDAEVVGMPAIFGIHEPDRVMAELQDMIGIPLFEIPTMPPSVPGIRLREMVEQVFPEKGVHLVPQQKVTRIELGSDRITLSLADSFGPIRIDAKCALMATGRFISGGLEAEMNCIREPLLDIPVTQPESRENWYNPRYVDGPAHEVHRAGIEVDDRFRPLDAGGTIVNERLFGAGIMLAHQDWIRSRSGAGIAIASAFRAVKSAAEYIRTDSRR